MILFKSAAPHKIHYGSILGLISCWIAVSQKTLLLVVEVGYRYSVSKYTHIHTCRYIHTTVPTFVSICLCVFMLYHNDRWCVFLGGTDFLPPGAGIRRESTGGCPWGPEGSRATRNRLSLGVTCGIIALLTSLVFSCPLHSSAHIPFTDAVAFRPSVNWLQLLPQKC